MFDTKIWIGSNKHSQNNKLGTCSASQDDIEVERGFKPQPGMRTNLQIDWSNQSDVFKEFIVQNTRRCKQAHAKQHTQIDLKPPPMIASTKAVLSDDSSIEVIKKSTKQEVIKKPRANNSNGLVASMHSRIVKKSKNNLTRAISDRMDDRLNKGEKCKVKELKNVILALEQTETSNTHISTINNVTNDGVDLTDDLYPVSSDKVLDCVRVYCDI